MVRPLHDLMNDLTTDAPADGFVARDLLPPGRARVRRRRLGEAAVVAALVGALAVTPLAFRPGSNPAPAEVPTGKVVDVGAADEAIAGVDYDLIRRRDPGEPRLDGYTNDGFAVVSRFPLGTITRTSPRPQVGLTPLDSGEVDWLPTAWDNGQMPLSFVSGDSKRLVFESSRTEVRRIWPQLWVFDRSTRHWTSRDLATLRPGGEFGVLALRGTAAWFTDNGNLWSRELSSDIAPRGFGMIGTAAAHDGLLAYTGGVRTHASHILLRDLDTGRTNSFPTGSEKSCSTLGLMLTATHVALGERCGRDTDHTRVFTIDGTPVVTIRGAMLHSVSSRFIATMAWTGPETGAFAFDIEAGRLMRLTRSTEAGYLTVRSHDDVVTWGDTVARFR